MANELENKNVEELLAMLKEAQANLLKLRFSLSEKQLKNVSQINKTKKEIARIKTAIKSLNPKK